MMMKMNCFCWIVDRRKMLSLIYSWTTQKMRLSIKHFFSKCEHLRRKLQIWLHLLKKSLMENFVLFCSAGTNVRGFHHCKCRHDTPWAGLQRPQILVILGFVEWSCAVVITTLRGFPCKLHLNLLRLKK